jgi:uncharacterized protein YceK
MKRIILLFLVIILLSSCDSVRYVNVNNKHNYYQKHRYNTYTIPTWIPGKGIMLETRIYRGHKPMRRKH